MMVAMSDSRGTSGPAGTSEAPSPSTLALAPKLVIGGRGGGGPAGGGADAALAFYGAVLGAEQVSRYAMADQVVMALVRLPGGALLQVKDADEVDPGPPAGGGGVILDVVCADPDAVAERAVEEGAEVVFPVADQPYGSRQGRFRDPWGHQWIVGTPVTMDDAEIQAALDGWGDAGLDDGED